MTPVNGDEVIAKRASRQSKSMARVFAKHWEVVGKGERLERLEHLKLATASKLKLFL
jgi:hypothetical protein